MRALQIQNDSNHSLALVKQPDPIFRAEQVLVKIHATAVNRADLLQRRGLYPPPAGESEILGLEAAGEIIALGPNVKEWQIGARVFCLLAGGGYAEKVAVHQKMLLPIPPAWTYEQAAAVPEAFYTAFANLFVEARLQARELLLIHAGGSGVGTAAIQMARLAGALVIVTAGSEDKLEECRFLGANHAINYKQDDFADMVRKLTNDSGVDVILDCVGASYFQKNLKLLRTRGRLVLIGLMGGAKTEVDLAVLMRKRLRVLGSVLRSRSLAEKIALTRLFRKKVLPQFENGNLHPVIDSVFPLAEAAQAHDYVASNQNFGKVVLRIA
ncbi:NAD(P)H-quinone oxidoreductase [candidate division KSB1 bacterium]|nr:NAD(P)H-quinone oxidoreductase [candidate division KSB1 bacterium]